MHRHRFASLIVAASIGAAIAPPSARAETPAQNSRINLSDAEPISVTRHTVRLRDGRRLTYTARAGFIPLINDATREVTAHVYFVSYTADKPTGSPPRPLTFTFPGGPGSTSTLNRSAPHVVTVVDGKARIVDNPDTDLASTDMVLIDPVGTGYSRVTRPEFTPLFYSIKGDRDSLVEFVRIYLQQFDEADSPIFLTGGSWGSVRSILVADAAIDRGIPIRGVMISAQGGSLAMMGSDAYYAYLIPAFTLIAHTHNKLPADLQADRAKAIAEAKAWAINEYLPAIATGNTLSAEERQRVVAQMARYSGLKPSVIEAHDLKLGTEAFANALLRDEGKSVGFYDTRKTGPLQTGAYDATKDPSLMARGSAFPTLAERHLLNRELGMRSTEYYAGPFGGGWPVRPGLDDWMSVKWGFDMSQEPVGSGIEIVLPTFVRIVDKGVPVLIGQGYYDWACPPFHADYVAGRASLARRDQVTVRYYESGHGVPHKEFGADSAAFIRNVLAQPAPPARPPMMSE